MTGSTHVVLTHRVELEADDRDTARRAQSAWLDHWTDAIQPALAAALDAVEAEAGPLWLERVEVDLGALTLDDFDTVPERLGEALPAAIARAVSGQRRSRSPSLDGWDASMTPGGRATAELTHRARAALHVVRHGYRPWWSPDVTDRALADALAREYEAGGSTIRTALIEAVADPRARRRLEDRFGEAAAVRRVIDGPAPARTAAPSTQASVGDPPPVETGPGDEGDGATRRPPPAQAPRRTVRADRRPPDPTPARAPGMRTAPGRVDAPLAGEPAKPSAGARPADPSRPAPADAGGIDGASARTEDAQRPASARGRAGGRADVEPSVGATPYVGPAAAPGPEPAGATQRGPDATPRAASAPPAPADPARTSASSPPTRPTPASDAPVAAPDAPPGRPRAPTSADGSSPAAALAAAQDHPSAPGSTVRPGERIPVTDAGLVLAWPFLPRVFRAQGWWTGADWQADGQQRAIHWLHRLAASSTNGQLPDASAQALVVPKLLCGLPLVEPVPRRLTLSADAVAAAEELLASMVAHWPALGSTSPDGLRRAFIRREGLLTHLGPDWHLRVQRQAHDVLLDRIPWGFGTVRLRWTPYTLGVEW